MKKLDPQLTSILLILGGLASMVVIVIFLFQPNFREIVQLSKDILQARTELDAQYANRKNLLTSMSVAVKGGTEIQKLKTQFVPAGREIDLITALENLAVKDGVEEHVTLSPGGDGSAVEVNEGYTLSINGRYHAVMQMLVDLEKIPTLMIVSAVTIHPGSDTNLAAAASADSFLSVNISGFLAAPPKGL